MNLGKPALILALFAATACAPADDNTPASEIGAGESEVKSSSGSIRGEVAIGLRAELLDAIGKSHSGGLDTTEADVPGAIKVRHQYSIEGVEANVGASWSFGPSLDSSKPQTELRFPSSMDSHEAALQLPAKKLFEAMTKATEKTDHNPVLNSDVVTRTSATGKIICAHETAYTYEGKAVPEGYDCKVHGLTSVGQSRSRF